MLRRMGGYGVQYQRFTVAAGGGEKDVRTEGESVGDWIGGTEQGVVHIWTSIISCHAA